MRTRAALVDTAWVSQHATDPEVRLIEADVDTTRYDRSHILGAVGWSWTADLNDPVRRDIPSREQFAHLLSRSGIRPDTTVVLYGANHNWFATFAAWLLEYYGHADVRLLDGGRHRWEAAGLPLAVETPRIEPTGYRVGEVRERLRAGRDEVVAALGASRVRLLDVRSPEEYTGETLAEPGLPLQGVAQRAGHIPGAVNVPWSKAVREDGTFRSEEELRRLYASVLDRPEVITYCRLGGRASHTWFALRHVLGLPDVRVYDGSWTEYGNLVGVPIRTGAEP